MSEAQIVQLGEVLRVKHGYAFKGPHFDDAGEELVLTPGNFKIGGGIQIRTGKERYYGTTYPAEFALQPGDLLIAMTDLTQNAPILGSPLFVPAEGRYLHNQRLGKVECLRNRLMPGYAYYLFVSDLVRSQLRSTATGATVRHTAPERVYRVRVTLPDLPIQSKIVAVLSGYDELINNNNRRIKILEEMAQRIYREWFGDFRYLGHESVPAVDSELGPIPEGWESVRVGDAFQTLGGGTPSRADPSYWDGGSVSWYTPSDLTAAKSVFMRSSKSQITELGLSRSAARLFPAGSVMMTSRATIGVVSVAASEACTNQGFIICVPNERVSTWHIYFWIHQIRDEIESLASGATFKEISRSEFRNLRFVLPPISVESAFTDAVQPMFEVIARLEAGVDLLRDARDLILPGLISGEIDVDNLNIAVPDAAA